MFTGHKEQAESDCHLSVNVLQSHKIHTACTEMHSPDLLKLNTDKLLKNLLLQEGIFCSDSPVHTEVLPYSLCIQGSFFVYTSVPRPVRGSQLLLTHKPLQRKGGGARTKRAAKDAREKNPADSEGSRGTSSRRVQNASPAWLKMTFNLP
uniref:Uncharacterized protein n=1 Tax=Anguilla anguilla TaxID=7936 RepID=A0A0E9WVU7_ANGAN